MSDVAANPPARLAVFDIDGTLVSGTSTERRFFRELLRGGYIGPRQWLASAGFVARYGPVHGRHVLKKNKAYLRGLEVAAVSAVAAGWVSSALTGNWFEPCLQRLRQHQANGDFVLLLSGTLDCIAQAIGATLEVSHVIGTLCAIEDGRFTAAPPLRHPFGAEKASMAAAHCASLQVLPADVVAYADSFADLELLRWAGSGVAVRPDARLARAARAAGWEIIADGDRHRAGAAAGLSH
jgi:phosphoserine phosphatase